MSVVLTTCGFCSCGCGVYVEGKNGGVATICPSANHPVSTGRLCFKGWNGINALTSADRLLTPLIRRGEGLQSVSWDEAISFTAAAIKRLASESGRQSLGIIGSAKTTNEECYSLVKFARSVLRTPNVDGPCRFYDASLMQGLLDTTGLPASQLDLNSLVDSGSMLIVGANVMEQLPHIGARIEDAALKGCRIVAVDPRTSRLAPHSALFLHPKPGTDIVWARALLKTIIDRRLYVESVPQVAGFEELLESLRDVDGGALQTACGIDGDAIGEVAEMLAGSPPLVVMFGLGVLQQAGSTQIVKALADIAVLLGGSVVALRGQNNAQGACDLGMVREFLPGYVPISDPVGRKSWEDLWRCELPGEPGMSALEMMLAARSGEIKALLVFGENPVLSAPNTQETFEALKKLDFLAVSDLYLTETAQLADVVFPACSFLEKDGTFTNIERRIQRVRKVLEPMGESKSDLDIVSKLAAALGTKMAAGPPEVMSEIAGAVPAYRDVSYEKLDETWGRQWAPDMAQTRLAPIAASQLAEDNEYAFRLIASRVNYHQQTGTMSGRFPILAREYPQPYAELNEADAESLGLRAGRPVRISSKSGALVRTLALSDGVPVGCVHVPHYFNGDSPNTLTSYESDPVSGVPVYKACPVKVEAVR